jgi:hypothetical protein
LVAPHAVAEFSPRAVIAGAADPEFAQIQPSVALGRGQLLRWFVFGEMAPAIADANRDRFRQEALHVVATRSAAFETASRPS